MEVSYIVGREREGSLLFQCVTSQPTQLNQQGLKQETLYTKINITHQLKRRTADTVKVKIRTIAVICNIQNMERQ
jgi:hypothetical protein